MTNHKYDSKFFSRLFGIAYLALICIGAAVLVIQDRPGLYY